jgi:tetratricopeptide (TPR) repeat protein
MGKIVFKHSGRLTAAGKYFAAITMLIFLFSIHSAYVHYHAYMGNTVYNEIVKQSNDRQSVTFSATESVKLEKSLYHLQLADAAGIFSPLSLNRELAAIYLYKKDYPQAEKHLVKMLAENPKDHEARLRLAKLMYVSNRTDAASEELKRIVTDNSQFKTEHDLKIESEAYLMLGHIEEKMGFAAAALAHFEQSYKNNQANTEAMLALGMTYTLTGRYAEAEKFLLACNEAMPGNALIHNNLGLIYIRMKNRDKAIVHLRELTRLQPENAQAQYNLGMILFSDGKKNEALLALEKAVNVNPDYMNAHIGLSKVLDEMGQKTEAELHRHRAEEIKIAMTSMKGTN